MNKRNSAESAGKVQIVQEKKCGEEANEIKASGSEVTGTEVIETEVIGTEVTGSKATGTKAIESEVIGSGACDISMMAPDALKDYVGRSVTLRGSVYKIRKMSGFCFVLVRTARHVIQCVCKEKELMEQLTEEACVKILADVVEEPRARFGAELHITGLEVLAMPAAQMSIVMNQKKLEASLENRLDYRPLTLRNERERAVFELQEGILRGFRKFFESEHFTEIPRLKFSQAKALVAEKAPGLFAGEKLPDQVAQALAAAGDSHDFDPEEERLLSQIVMEETGSPFIFVTHYPTAKRPFYVMEDPDNPEETLSFDLIFRGLEITTGGQRIHDYEMQVAKMNRFGMNMEDFESYLMIHKCGMPPHGGLGLGLERLTARLLGFENVRQGSLFPRDIHRLTP